MLRRRFVEAKDIADLLDGGDPRARSLAAHDLEAPVDRRGDCARVPVPDRSDGI